MSRFLTAAALSTLLVHGTSAAVAAQAPRPAPEPLVEELLEVMEMDRQIREAILFSVEAQMQANPALASFGDVFEEFFEKYVTWEAMKPELVKVYAGAFTESEVRDLIAFYRTPVGRKLVEQSGELMRQGGTVGQRLVEAHAAELEAMIQKRAQQLQQGGDVH